MTSTRLAWRRLTTAFFALIALLLGSIALAGPAAAAGIASSGPLTEINISPTLNCDVRHAADTDPEWYDAIACGTFVQVGTDLFGPTSIPAGSSVTTRMTPFTPVSQTGPTGSGTSADPYRLTTVVKAGTTGVTVTQVDSYVRGQESYRTEISLASSTTTTKAVKVYRGGDCYLQNSDVGRGLVQNGNSPVCRGRAGSVDPDRVEGFYPLTTGAYYMEANYNQVWTAIASGNNLPNTCRCDEEIDNGVAINWSRNLGAGASLTFASLTFFSPIGSVPVTFTKTANSPTSAQGATNGYTVRIVNPGAVPATLTSIIDSLPSQFTYVPGSTTGFTTANPTVSGSTLTWNGNFVVPAATGTTPGEITMKFRVVVGGEPGTYTNTVTGEGQGVTAVAANEVAPITVTPAPTPTPTPTVTPSPTVTPTPTPTVTPTPTPTVTPSPTVTPTPTPTATPTPTPTATPSTPSVVQTDGAGPAGPAPAGLVGAGGLLLLATGVALVTMRRRESATH